MNLLKTKNQSLADKLAEKNKEAAEQAGKIAELQDRLRKMELAAREHELLVKELTEKAGDRRGNGYEEEDYEEEH
jgi:hypothetical protein